MHVIETGDRVASREYVRWMRETPGLDEAVARLLRYDSTAADDGPDGDPSPALVASAVEFDLEGLHLQRRINKDRAATGVVYRARDESMDREVAIKVFASGLDGDPDVRARVQREWEVERPSPLSRELRP